MKENAEQPDEPRVGLPNGHRAFIDMSKLLDYCLSPDHPRGRHKARRFAATLGITRENAAELLDALLQAARDGEAAEGDRDDYGQRYVVDFLMTGSRGAATVRSGWIIRTGEDFPRLTSAFVR